MLAKALDLASDVVQNGNPGDVGSQIEQEIYDKLINPRDSSEKLRQLLFNLKDPKNPDLRARVLLGEISPQILISLSTEELASD